MIENKIGDEGARTLSEMVKKNTTLKELYLSRKEEERKKRKKIEKRRMNDR